MPYFDNRPRNTVALLDQATHVSEARRALAGKPGSLPSTPAPRPPTVMPEWPSLNWTPPVPRSPTPWSSTSTPVTFDAAGRASAEQRVTAEELREFVGTSAAGVRARLVRDSAVSGGERRQPVAG